MTERHAAPGHRDSHDPRDVRHDDWRERWPHGELDWSPAYRVIPTRFPAVNLFDRVASPEDFDALYALEAMTNDRLRTEVGELDLVPPDERCFGPGCGPIMAALTHLNPNGSRFSDGSYGVFYCARVRPPRSPKRAITRGNFSTRRPSRRCASRCVSTRCARARRAWWTCAATIAGAMLDPRCSSPDDYLAPDKALGRRRRARQARRVSCIRRCAMRRRVPRRVPHDAAARLPPRGVSGIQLERHERGYGVRTQPGRLIARPKWTARGLRAQSPTPPSRQRQRRRAFRAGLFGRDRPAPQRQRLHDRELAARPERTGVDEHL